MDGNVVRERGSKLGGAIMAAIVIVVLALVAVYFVLIGPTTGAPNAPSGTIVPAPATAAPAATQAPAAPAGPRYP